MIDQQRKLHLDKTFMSTWYPSKVHVKAVLTLTCGLALDAAGGGVGLGGLRGGPQRPAALWQPSLLPSDCATLPEQSSSSHTTLGALHATCACKLAQSVRCGSPQLAVVLQ